MHNTSKQTNDIINIWNSKPNIRYTTKTVCGHFAPSEEKIMHMDAVNIELIKNVYFIEMETEKHSKIISWEKI